MKEKTILRLEAWIWLFLSLIFLWLKGLFLYYLLNWSFTWFGFLNWWGYSLSWWWMSFIVCIIMISITIFSFLKNNIHRHLYIWLCFFAIALSLNFEYAALSSSKTKEENKEYLLQQCWLQQEQITLIKHLDQTKPEEIKLLFKKCLTKLDDERSSIIPSLKWKYITMYEEETERCNKIWRCFKKKASFSSDFYKIKKLDKIYYSTIINNKSPNSSELADNDSIKKLMEMNGIEQKSSLSDKEKEQFDEILQGI